METQMPRPRGTLSVALSVLISISLLPSPVWGNPSLGAGTIVSAERGHLGTAAASVGATVFAGDKLNTDVTGSLQIRTGSARLVLSASSQLIWGIDDSTAGATLTGGTAAFFTVSANAFVLHASTAAVQPRGDGTTVAKVNYLHPQEIV